MTTTFLAALIPFSMQVLAPKSTGKEITTTITRTDDRPAIDGVLDDSAWLNVDPIRGFMQYHPVEGIPPSESTELYITYDESNFYLAFRCYDSQPEEIRATLTHRESWENDDCIGFAFDTYNSEREAFLFNINPYGIPSDFIWHHDGYCDNGWDSDVRSRGKIHSDSYCIECAVPFKSLRMPNRSEQEWGFYALRSIKRKGEMDIWPSRTHEIPNLLAQASLLKGIREVRTGNNLTVLPYLFLSSIRNDQETQRPFDLGVDLRYSITSTLMLDATLNPDYSQIEADPDRLELTERYAYTLPEKRPFFTEGTDIFSSNQWLFYSRRIGNPIGGLKVTGKQGKYRFGFLSSLDEEIDSGGKIYYNHLRVKREIFDESTVGLFVTNRDEVADGTYNRVLSADGVFRFRNVYSLKSQATGTVSRTDTSTFRAIGYNLNLERFGQNSYHSLWYNDFPQNFDAGSGAMWELIGYRELGLHNGLFIRQPIQLINDCELHFGGKARFNGDDELAEDYLWASAETSLDRVWTEFEIRRNHERHFDETFRYSQFEYELWSTPVRQIECYFSVLWGDAPYYREGFTGWKLRTVTEVTLKPLPRLVYEVDLSREDFYYGRGGNRCYLQTIVWNKLSYQILRGMFLREIYQYNSADRRSDASLLFAFEYSPLSNVYVGANFRNFSGLRDVNDNLELFAKIGYLWRL